MDAAQEILDLLNRASLHPDSRANQTILKTDIENIIYRADRPEILELRATVDQQDHEIRQLNQEIEELESELEED